MFTCSESSMPKLECEAFHSIYRKMYTILTIQLMQDPRMALQIMAFWIWMEKSGFTDTVKKIYELPLDLICGLADEAIVCINFFKDAIFPTPSELNNSIPMLHFLMKEELHLLFLPVNRASAVVEMKRVYCDVCLVDLEDLFIEANGIHEVVNHRLSDQVDELSGLFNAKASLGDTTVGSNYSPVSSDLTSSGCIGFGFGSSSLQRGSLSSELGISNLGLSESMNLRSCLFKTPPCNAGNFEPDPIKVVRPGSLVSPHGYVGMERERSTSNWGFTNVGVIGQPLVPSSNSFHQELCTPRKTHGYNLSSSRHLILNHAVRVGPSTIIQPYCVWNFPVPETFIPAEQRTLFVTFSKGYRVREAELRDFITDYFGYCIESLYMQETHGNEQPLYARIVFFSPETIEVVLDGSEKAKYTINGKHVWVRKFIPKNQRNNNHRV